MADQDTLRQFQEIKSVVAHYDATFANITPPQVVYKEEEARLRRQIHDEAVRLRTAQSDDETAMREDTIIELGGQMADLKRHYTANREKYAREHEVRLKQTLDMLRGRLGQLLGLSSTTQIQTTNGQEARDQGPPDQDQNQIPPAQENEAVGGESAQGSSQASQNAQTGTTANKSARRNAPNNENTEATSEPEGVINEGPTFNDQDDDHVHNHDKNDASNHEKNDNVVNGDESADIEMGDAEPIETEPIRHREQLAVRMSIDITPVSRNLRTVPLSPASTCDDSTTVRRDSQHLPQSQGPTNVSPRNIPPPTPRETRSKKRKALNSASTTQKRHRTGPTGSTESPLESAAEQSRQSTTRTSRRTTREHSNKSSQHASEPPAKVLPRRSNRHPEESAGSGKFEGIVDPKPGNVYATYWKKTKEWLAVVLLPMGDFSTVGIPGSIISCDLVDSLPLATARHQRRDHMYGPKVIGTERSMRRSVCFLSCSLTVALFLPRVPSCGLKPGSCVPLTSSASLSLFLTPKQFEDTSNQGIGPRTRKTQTKNPRKIPKETLKETQKTTQKETQKETQETMRKKTQKEMQKETLAKIWNKT
ncbi:hypothetical protein NXS19_006265 [Fusarium pseudograminearum]|nr:hypothetical protein NXS19_006265 [Fusarium pseudograminearum]